MKRDTISSKNRTYYSPSSACMEELQSSLTKENTYHDNGDHNPLSSNASSTSYSTNSDDDDDDGIINVRILTKKGFTHDDDDEDANENNDNNDGDDEDRSYWKSIQDQVRKTMNQHLISEKPFPKLHQLWYKSFLSSIGTI